MKSCAFSPKAKLSQADAVQRTTRSSATLVNNRPQAAIQRELQATIAHRSRQIVQRHPMHWLPDFDKDVEKISALDPGFLSATRSVKSSLREYSAIPEDEFEKRSKALTKIEKKLGNWDNADAKKHGPEIARLQKKITYEWEEIALSKSRMKGQIDVDLPAAWRQASSFPTNQEYEITFRGLMKLKIPDTGVDAVKLGEMDDTDKANFPRATPEAMVTYANTGTSISTSRSFEFADAISAKTVSIGKSNLLAVQVIRPGYGIDVERHAADIDTLEGREHPGALTAEERTKDQQKAFEAKEIATLRNPPELIIGWIEFPHTILKEHGGSAAAATKAGAIKFIRNQAYGTGPYEGKLPKLEDMKNYEELQKLLGKY